MSIEEVYRYIDVVSQNAFLGLTPSLSSNDRYSFQATALPYPQVEKS